MAKEPRELLLACEEADAARNRAESTALVGALDEVGFVLLFGDKVYLALVLSSSSLLCIFSDVSEVLLFGSQYFVFASPFGDSAFYGFLYFSVRPSFQW